MAEGHGGYRAPLNPAAVSGPGALSQRTDGGPQGRSPRAEYGENQEMAAASAGLGQPAPIDPSGLVPMEAGTTHPDVPVTDGMDMGAPGAMSPGIGDDILNMRSHYPVLKFVASQPHASNALRQFVRELGSEIDGGQQF